jgi:hypothetical protein
LTLLRAGRRLSPSVMDAYRREREKVRGRGDEDQSRSCLYHHMAFKTRPIEGTVIGGT